MVWFTEGLYCVALCCFGSVDCMLEKGGEMAPVIVVDVANSWRLS